MQRLTILFLMVLLVMGLTVISYGADDKLVFYWLSHGTSNDPIWVYAINGAHDAGKALGVTIKSSFHQNDIASQKEAFRAAIAANADGIASTTPQPEALKEEIEMAKSKGIPVVLFNSDDPGTKRDAFVGANLYQAGQQWANYLVANNLVKKGDKVWLPVEAPGATYQVEETKGIASVFEPMGIEYEVFDAGNEPANAIARMTEYLIAHGNDISAMIGLGDLVMGNVKQVWDNVKLEPGKISVVGWGNSLSTAKAVKEGYVNAATWQYPVSLGFMPITMLYMANKGMAIGYDITTLALYEQENADIYIDLTK